MERGTTKYTIDNTQFYTSTVRCPSSFFLGGPTLTNTGGVLPLDLKQSRCLAIRKHKPTLVLLSLQRFPCLAYHRTGVNTISPFPRGESLAAKCRFGLARLAFMRIEIVCMLDRNGEKTHAMRCEYRIGGVNITARAPSTNRSRAIINKGHHPTIGKNVTLWENRGMRVFRYSKELMREPKKRSRRRYAMLFLPKIVNVIQVHQRDDPAIRSIGRGIPVGGGGIGAILRLQKLDLGDEVGDAERLRYHVILDQCVSQRADFHFRRGFNVPCLKPERSRSAGSLRWLSLR